MHRVIKYVPTGRRWWIFREYNIMEMWSVDCSMWRHEGTVWSFRGLDKELSMQY